MTTRIGYWLSRVRESYWFVPSLMAVGSILMAFVSLWIDDRLHEAGRYPVWIGWIYQGSPEGARSVLSTIAGSMITVAGVVFSITIVVLALASTQLGPRLLRNFMRDRRHQAVLGTFVSSFLYCLLGLRAVGGPDDFVPEVTIALGIISAMLSIGVLIYFIHHIAISIQVPQVVLSLSSELRESMQQVFPDQIGSPPSPDTVAPVPVDTCRAEVRATRTGYLAGFEGSELINLAASFDGVIRLDVRPGEFLTVSTVIAAVWPESKLDPIIARCINQAMIVSPVRTKLQDVDFAIDQLVEIALRALSPGINDPLTARDCVDRLTEGYLIMLGRKDPSSWRCDKSGRVRVVARRFEFAELLESAFGPIRHYGRDSVLVLARMVQRLGDMAVAAVDPVTREAIRNQLDCLSETAQASVLDTVGQKAILSQCELLKKRFDNH